MKNPLISHNSENQLLNAKQNSKKKHGIRSNEEIEQLILNNNISKINIYGSDVDVGTLNRNNNVLNLYEIPDSIREFSKEEGDMPGIATPYSYIATIGSVFAWHTEDCNFSSISILLNGMPKIWYAIASSQSKQFESLIALHRPKTETCEMYVPHKDTWFTPEFIEQNGIKVTKVSKLISYLFQYFVLFRSLKKLTCLHVRTTIFNRLFKKKVKSL